MLPAAPPRELGEGGEAAGPATCSWESCRKPLVCVWSGLFLCRCHLGGYWPDTSTPPVHPPVVHLYATGRNTQAFLGPPELCAWCVCVCRGWSHMFAVQRKLWSSGSSVREVLQSLGVCWDAGPLGHSIPPVLEGQSTGANLALGLPLCRVCPSCHFQRTPLVPTRPREAQVTRRPSHT